MGETLTAAVAIRRADLTGGQVARLYAANTLDAVAGAVLGGFVLLPTPGLRATIWGTGATTWVLALLAYGFGRIGPPMGSAPPTRSPRPVGAQQDGRSSLLIIAALVGFCGLLYEVAWFRSLVLVLGASAYAFSILLPAFLLGIGLGGCWACQ